MIAGLISPEGEEISFPNPLNTRGDIEIWLLALEKA